MKILPRLPQAGAAGLYRSPFLGLLVLPLLSACAGGSGPAPTDTGSDTPESVWDALYAPRPEPLSGATRVTVSDFLILNDPWNITGPISTGLGIQELLSANLLRRRDVHFVERRRFSREAEMERRGERRLRGAPPVGVSPGPELAFSGSWAAMGPDSAYLDVRLVDPESGRVVTSFRRTTPRDADPVALAREGTAGLLDALAELQRLPSWEDPQAGAAPETYRPSGVPLDAVAAFFRGVAAEDEFRWDPARVAYQEALELGGASFVEARAALARIARLRAGGSLGAGNTP